MSDLALSGRTIGKKVAEQWLTYLQSNNPEAAYEMARQPGSRMFSRRQTAQSDRQGSRGLECLQRLFEATRCRFDSRKWQRIKLDVRSIQVEPL